MLALDQGALAIFPPRGRCDPRTTGARRCYTKTARVRREANSSARKKLSGGSSRSPLVVGLATSLEAARSGITERRLLICSGSRPGGHRPPPVPAIRPPTTLGRRAGVPGGCGSGREEQEARTSAGRPDAGEVVGPRSRSQVPLARSQASAPAQRRSRASPPMPYQQTTGPLQGASGLWHREEFGSPAQHRLHPPEPSGGSAPNALLPRTAQAPAQSLVGQATRS